MQDPGPDCAEGRAHGPKTHLRLLKPVDFKPYRLALLPVSATLLFAGACSQSPFGSSGDGDGDGQGNGGVPGVGDGDALGVGGNHTEVPGAGGQGPATTCTLPPITPPTLAEGTGSCPPGNGIALQTAEFCVTLDGDSHALTSLRPRSDTSFDFAPSDRLGSRQGDGYMHLGDLTLRLRSVGQTSWQNFSTSETRSPVTPIGPLEGALDAANLAPTLADMPLSIAREWGQENGRLTLKFTLENTSTSAVEVGALGMPLVFNNIITGRSLEQAHATCSFSDPYIGAGAGYVQVTRLSGEGPALLVLPWGDTPLEAYGEVLNLPAVDSDDPDPMFFDLTPRNQTFEGFHQWLVHSSAFMSDQWSGVTPYNTPTNVTLEPGQARTYGLTFVLSESIREIESTLQRELRPVAVGVPGTILPMDVEGKLFIRYSSDVTGITVEPAGALEVMERDSTASCTRVYSVLGKTWGRSRINITYEDGSLQTVHYNVIAPAEETVQKMGEFLTTEAWFEDPSDPFGRSPSVMTYDKSTGDVVSQAKQAWVAGLGDDGGATWLAGIMKLSGQPDAAQIAKYEQFVDDVVWGGLQYDSGDLMYGVKRTLFYYEPNELPANYYSSSIDWTTWMSWPRAHTLEVPRSYNYPHVTALYLTLYRLARTTTGLVTHHPWDWYLDQAYETAVAMTTIGNQYAEFGLMDGSVFLDLLQDLEREEWEGEASDLEGRMKERADHWATLPYPFGSEMAWDSTGQEEVYLWSKHFGYDDKARITLDAILGYTPTVPHWGYNGCARRYWDFIYGGAKIDRLERMLHHYGSSLNAIPVLSEFRDEPSDFHLLRIGHAGMMGPLTNIDQDGFPSMAFHSFSDTLAWDERTGDYGLAFYGHAVNAATYLAQHDDYGWVSFGGNVTVVGDVASGGTVEVSPRDSFRRRLYIAPLGLWLTLDAGRFARAIFEPSTGSVTVTLDPAEAHSPTALLRVDRPGASEAPPYRAPAEFAVERGAVVVPLGVNATSLTLSAN